MTSNTQLFSIDSKEQKKAFKAIKKSGNRIGHNYVIIKSLKRSLKNDVVKCFYMKSLIDFGFCVIKEGSPSDQKDKDGRDILDRLIWQSKMHKILQHKVRIPGLVDTFEENGNYYLVIEHISGQSLSNFIHKYGYKIRTGLINGNRLGKRALRYLLQAVKLLERLHDNHVVHRDLTATNYMINRFGKVFLIDMELSYSLENGSPNPPFQLGTHGYMSPEQLATETPTINEDVFAFGAILLQIWTSISPVKLTDAEPEDLAEKIAYFIPDARFSTIVTRCLSKAPIERPKLTEVREVISEYYADMVKKRKDRKITKNENYTDQQIRDVLKSSIKTLSTNILSDPDKGWFANDEKADVDKHRMNKGWFASFHIGNSGILYFLGRAKHLGYDIALNEGNINKAIELIDRKYIQRPGCLSGLHFGADGIAISLSTCVYANILERGPKYEDWIEFLLSRGECSGLDIMNGTAGRIMANLICYRHRPSEGIRNRLDLYIRQILEYQERDGSWARGDETVKGKKRVTKGFAHGVAGIIYALFEYSALFSDEKCRESAEKALVWLIRSAKWRANKMYWRSSIGKLVNPWWCDGAPGVALCFLKAYENNQNPLYKKYAEAALRCDVDNIYYSNLSQCNGISGLGEIYLEAHRVLKDDIWLQRAASIVQLLMRLAKRSEKYGMYWLVESEQQPIPGFMLGNAGILHFVMRYLDYTELGFPLSTDLNMTMSLLKTDEVTTEALLNSSSS